MKPPPLYPLRFVPLFQARVWGGRRLANVLATPLPGHGPIGEAWMLSDREEQLSVIANGALKGQTLRQLLQERPEAVLGAPAGRSDRFPLLLKFLDAREQLSLQVHPSDRSIASLPPGETGKTEAWIVLDAGSDSRVDAGWKHVMTPESVRAAVAAHSISDHLASFRAQAGDTIFLPAGVVHSFRDLVVFEVQQNSDVTYRLSDWDRVDPATGQPRPLQFEQALASLDFAAGPVRPSVPIVQTTIPVRRELLVRCVYFEVSRISGFSAFDVGVPGLPRVVVGLTGSAQLEHAGGTYAIRAGDVLLLPADVGVCRCRPRGHSTLLEIAVGGEK